MNELIFGADSKLSEMVSAYPALLYSLPRFRIALGFGDKSVSKICEENGISTHLFLLICNVCCFDRYEPSVSDIKATEISQLLPYLRTAHAFYLGNRLPHISKHLTTILSRMPLRVAAAFNNFFSEYKREVVAHFEYEEQNVYPHIEMLLQGKRNESFGINDFVDEHGDMQDKLNDLSQIIFKYLPADTATSDETIDVVFDILQLSADLAKHSLIEEKILVPYVRFLERSLK